jgi:hypothetical protein
MVLVACFIALPACRQGKSTGETSNKITPEKVLHHLRAQIGQLAVDVEILHNEEINGKPVLSDAKYLQARRGIEKAAQAFNKINRFYKEFKTIREADKDDVIQWINFVSAIIGEVR